METALLLPQRRDLRGDRSAFTGITTVPAGSRLILDGHRGKQVRSAWTPPTAHRGLAEGAQALRAALDAAVQVRVSTAVLVSADCSGGLDSTSLTLLAARHLTAAAPLHAVTIHPAGIHQGGDLDYARAATAGQPSVRHLLCPLSSEHLPYSRLAELVPVTDEPAPTTVAIARAVAEFDWLGEVGSDCHLTGDGGDTLLGGHPAHLADLARAGMWPMLFQHSVGWARLRRAPVWPLLGAALATAARGHHRTPRTSLESLPVWSTGHARNASLRT